MDPHFFPVPFLFPVIGMDTAVNLKLVAGIQYMLIV